VKVKVTRRRRSFGAYINVKDRILALVERKEGRKNIVVVAV